MNDLEKINKEIEKVQKQMKQISDYESNWFFNNKYQELRKKYMELKLRKDHINSGYNENPSDEEIDVINNYENEFNNICDNIIYYKSKIEDLIDEMKKDGYNFKEANRLMNKMKMINKKISEILEK